MGDLTAFLVGVVIALVGLFGARLSGKKAARNEQQADEREAIDKAKKVKDEVSSLDDDDVNTKLTSWLRGGKR